MAIVSVHKEVISGVEITITIQNRYGEFPSLGTPPIFDGYWAYIELKDSSGSTIAGFTVPDYQASRFATFHDTAEEALKHAREYIGGDLPNFIRKMANP